MPSLTGALSLFGALALNLHAHFVHYRFHTFQQPMLRIWALLELLFAHLDDVFVILVSFYTSRHLSGTLVPNVAMESLF